MAYKKKKRKRKTQGYDFEIVLRFISLSDIKKTPRDLINVYMYLLREA